MSTTQPPRIVKTEFVGRKVVGELVYNGYIQVLGQNWIQAVLNWRMLFIQNQKGRERAGCSHRG